MMSTFALVCFILSLTCYVIYLSVIGIKYKSISCISESYYLLLKKNWFTIWIITIAFLTFPAWVEVSPIMFQFLPFLSVIALGVVGLCPKYLESERTIHMVSAGMTGILSVLWNIVSGVYFIPLTLLCILIILAVIKVNNLLLWTEILAFCNIYLSILLI